MRKFSIAFFTICSLLQIAFGQQANLWPLPREVSLGSTSVSLDPKNFLFVCGGSSCSDVLTNAFSRYYNYIFFAEKYQASNPLKGSERASSLTQVIVSAGSLPPLQVGYDESYSIVIDSNGATIEANTEWGALHGLETFAQLVSWDPDSNLYSIPYLPVNISDYPRFPWRGLLVDTARHYEPLRVLFRAIDSLSWNKFNTLHWHIVDEQSFPYVSVTYPLLSSASWVPKAIYTPDDVQRVIDYGYSRGVRVVPEFDTPGHSTSWGKGYPQLFPNCTYPNVFDPTKSYTIDFMSNFLAEVAKAYPDEFMHMGGDEVQFTCWEQDPAITAWMNSHGIATYKELQAYYEQQIEKIVDNLDKSPIFWEEVFDNSPTGSLNKNSVVHVWFSNTSKVEEAVKQGYRTLFSSPWYLDQQIPNHNEEFYLWVDTWMDFYDADPTAGLTLNATEEALVLGGEACMWGEQVDETVFDERVWPRAAAIGERLWSDASVNNNNQAQPRLGTQRCRMVQRGVKASPIYPDYCETGRPPNDLDEGFIF